MDMGYSYGTDQGRWKPIPPNATLQEYYKQYAKPSFYQNLKYLSWGLYATAIVNLLPLIMTPISPLLWSDVILVALMGRKLTKKRRSSTAWSILIYGIFNVIGGIFLPMDGWMDMVVLVIGILAVMAFRNAKQEYKRLKQSRVTQDEAFY
jgi:uncharacterized membrane protein